MYKVSGLSLTTAKTKSVKKYAWAHVTLSSQPPVSWAYNCTAPTVSGSSHYINLISYSCAGNEGDGGGCPERAGGVTVIDDAPLGSLSQ